MAGSRRRAFYKTISAPDQKGQTKNYSKNRKCHGKRYQYVENAGTSFYREIRPGTAGNERSRLLVWSPMGQDLHRPQNGIRRLLARCLGRVSKHTDQTLLPCTQTFDYFRPASDHKWSKSSPRPQPTSCPNWRTWSILARKAACCGLGKTCTYFSACSNIRTSAS